MFNLLSRHCSPGVEWVLPTHLYRKKVSYSDWGLAEGPVTGRAGHV